MAAGIVCGIDRCDPDDNFLVGFFQFRKCHCGRNLVIPGSKAALGGKIVHAAIDWGKKQYPSDARYKSSRKSLVKIFRSEA